jgi:hypothetical protein
MFNDGRVTMGLIQYLIKRIKIYHISQRNKEIGIEMNNLILKQGQLTDTQRKVFHTELEDLKNELKTCE